MPLADAIRALRGGVLRRFDLLAGLAAQDAHGAPDRVRLPARGFHNFRQHRAFGPLYHRQNFGFFVRAHPPGFRALLRPGVLGGLGGGLLRFLLRRRQVLLLLRTLGGKALDLSFAFVTRHRAGCNSLAGSSGLRFARALIHDPRLILCDEPTSALDARSGIKVMEFCEIAVRPDRSVIVVTHDSRVFEFADTVAHTEDSRITQVEEGAAVGVRKGASV